jgi:uncharacterized membrane protein YcfT
VTPVDDCVCGWCADKRSALRRALARGVLLRVLAVGAWVAAVMLLLSLTGCADPELVRTAGGWQLRNWFGACCWIAVLVVVLRASSGGGK